ncbi:hypothetical protein J6590_033946 [Homalodisca vitripennis]|nr:hypothetical protein J6590_033946 [Homalodisca vitripennis]
MWCSGSALTRQVRDPGSSPGGARGRGYKVKAYFSFRYGPAAVGPPPVNNRAGGGGVSTLLTHAVPSFSACRVNRAQKRNTGNTSGVTNSRPYTGFSSVFSTK